MKLLKKGGGGGGNSKAIEKYEAERKATKNAREEVADVNHLNSTIAFLDGGDDSFTSVVSEISAPPSMRESFYKQNIADLDFTDFSSGSKNSRKGKKGGGRRRGAAVAAIDADDSHNLDGFDADSLYSGDGGGDGDALSRSGHSAAGVSKEKSSKQQKKKKKTKLRRIKKLFGSRHTKSDAIAEGEEEDDDEDLASHDEFYCDTSDDDSIY